MVVNGRGRDGASRRVRGLDAEQRRAQRRHDLLAAALTLFAERGFADVAIEELCKRAFVGTKSFYELFDTKEQCYLALFDEITEQLKAEMERSAAELDGDPARLAEAFGRALVRDHRVAAVLFVRSGGVSAAVEAHRRANRRWAAAFVAAVWRAALPGAAQLPDPGLERIALGLVGGMFELVGDWLHGHDPAGGDSVDALAGRLGGFHGVVFDGLVARSGARAAAPGAPPTLGS